jgi:hypothetical protein
MVNHNSLACRGEVSEWTKEAVLKTAARKTGRGFESHPLRRFECEYI